MNIRNVTYRTPQGQTRTGTHEGVTHKATGELLIQDDRTAGFVYVKPAFVTFLDS